MNRIDDICLFLRVLDLGSISAAARSLDLSVAVASQRLKRLERDLGVRLLHRTTRQLHATPEGTALAEQGRVLIEDLEALTSGLRKSGSSVSGPVRVTMPAAFGRQYVSPLLPQFLARHPGIKLNVNLSDQVVDLVTAGFDLAIRIGVLSDSSLVARRLATNKRVLCAAPAYLKQHGTPRTPADLAHHECLLQVGSHGRQDIWGLSDANGRPLAVRVDGRFESNFGELLSDAALAGLGVALHSTWHIGGELRAGRLRVVLSDYPPPDTGIYAVTPQRRMVPQRVQAFIDFLAEHFSDDLPWEKHLRHAS
ncbi:LysR family transcriptional regulator [Dyella koreensis]|uniref:LysR family transcriptional regulator n=1 Tax=Dyella koreensis TaxID=311235 RepID=A0ABW8JZ90_9GAMM